MKIFSFILLVFALSFTVFAIQSGDTLMYLSLARDFFLNGSFPRTDPYLYSLPQAPLHLAHEYLSYFIFYGVWRAAGFAGLIFFKAALLGLLFALPLRAGPRERNLSPFWVALWMLAVYAASFRFIERSSLFSDLFCVLTVDWLTRANRVDRKFILKFSALFLVWIQVHAGFPLGMAMLGLWALWKAVTDPSFRNRRSLWLLLPFTLLLINPLGLEGVLYPFRFALNEARVLKHHNFEWFASYHPAFRFTPEVSAFWLLLLACVACLSLPRARSGLNLMLFAAANAVQAVRFIPWAAFAMLILVKPQVPRFTFKSAVWRWSASLLLLAFAVKNFGWGYNSSSGERKPSLQLDSNFFPVQSLAFLRAHPLPGRLYNTHDFGSYLIWENYTPIFHHGFVTDMAFYENDAVGVFQSQQRFLELAKKYNWTKLLVDKHGSYPYFYRILSPLTNWKIVAEDDASYLIYDLPE